MKFLFEALTTFCSRTKPRTSSRFLHGLLLLKWVLRTAYIYDVSSLGINDLYHFMSSPIEVVRLNMKVEAPVWGRAKAAPKPKALTFSPPPIESPDMKSRL